MMEDAGQAEEEALAEAYAHEDAVADAASQTVGAAWLFAVVPAGLVLLLLAALLGEWVWRLLPVLAVAAIAAAFLARLVVRWRSGLPIALPGRAPISGRRKKLGLIGAAALFVAAVAGDAFWPGAYVWLRDTLLGWRI